jgi:hypothetical protein
MTPEAVVTELRATGVRLTIEDGKIKATGNKAALERWLPVLRERRAEIIAALKVGPEATHADILERHPDAVAAELPKPDPFPDDRRTCDQCANLIAGQCQAAKRGEIIGASRNYEPIRDLPRRCEGYAPGADDPDRRHGLERWPGLIQKGGE